MLAKRNLLAREKVHTSMKGRTRAKGKRRQVISTEKGRGNGWYKREKKKKLRNPLTTTLQEEKPRRQRWQNRSSRRVEPQVDPIS